MTLPRFVLMTLPFEEVKGYWFICYICSNLKRKCHLYKCLKRSVISTNCEGDFCVIYLYFFLDKLHGHPQCLVKLDSLHPIFNKWHFTPKFAKCFTPFQKWTEVWIIFGAKCQLFWSCWRQSIFLLKNKVCQV